MPSLLAKVNNVMEEGLNGFTPVQNLVFCLFVVLIFRKLNNLIREHALDSKDVLLGLDQVGIEGVLKGWAQKHCYCLQEIPIQGLPHCK